MKEKNTNKFLLMIIIFLAVIIIIIMLAVILVLKIPGVFDKGNSESNQMVSSSIDEKLWQ